MRWLMVGIFGRASISWMIGCASISWMIGCCVTSSSAANEMVDGRYIWMCFYFMDDWMLCYFIERCQ